MCDWIVGWGEEKVWSTVAGKFGGSFIASLASRGKIVGGQICKKATLHILRPATSRILQGPLTAAVRQGSPGRSGPALARGWRWLRTVLVEYQGTTHPYLRARDLEDTVCLASKMPHLPLLSHRGASFSPPFLKNIPPLATPKASCPAMECYQASRQDKTTSS